MTFLTGETGAELGRPRTFLNIVLDKSYSMEDARTTTIQAFNDFIARQKEASASARDEVFVTLTQFSSPSEIRTLYALKPLQDVRPLTSADFKPDGGTALYDGIWSSIQAMEKAVGEQARVLMLVITDGAENCSRVITDIDELKRIVEIRQERGNWTFVFLSAGSNPYRAGQDMGFQIGNISTYAAGASIGNALVRVSSAVESYRHGDHMQTSSFWAGEAPKHDAPQWTKSVHDDEVEDVV